MTPNRGTRTGVGVARIALLALVVVGVWAAIAYKGLVRADEQLRAQRAEVEAAYQRRNAFIADLVETVKRAPVERQAFAGVARARAAVGQIPPATLRGTVEDPQAFARAQQAQDELGDAASRLVEALEPYPQLRADPRFRSLQIQLVGTGLQIAQERARFDRAAEAFNARRNRFPTVLLARLFGQRFADKPSFGTRPGTEAPEPAVL